MNTFCMIGWLWYFIDLHRVRYSHAGEVCFGDKQSTMSISEIEENENVYMESEGAFLRYMIIS